MLFPVLWFGRLFRIRSSYSELFCILNGMCPVISSDTSHFCSGCCRVDARRSFLGCWPMPTERRPACFGNSRLAERRFGDSRRYDSHDVKVSMKKERNDYCAPFFVTIRTYASNSICTHSMPTRRSRSSPLRSGNRRCKPPVGYRLNNQFEHSMQGDVVTI